MTKGNVIIAGTYPPPIGGVTIHIKRLKLLLDSSEYENYFVNIRPMQKTKVCIDKKKYIKSLICCIRLAKNGVLHYQLNNWVEACLLAIGSKVCGAKLVYTVHSLRIEEFSLIKRLCFRITSKYAFKFIAPSLTTKEKLIFYNVNESKIMVLDTYLPPTENELNEPVPNELMEFFNRSNYVVLANASKLYLDDDNTDIYGLDMCIEVCASLPEISFLFCVPIIEDELYLDKSLKKIVELGIKSRFIIYDKEISLASLFRFVDLFVRPTSTDSFGISVAEAISCKIPSLASDVCNRAKGTILFKSRDSEDFFEKIKFCIDKKTDGSIIEMKDNYIKSYVEFYESIIH